MRRTLLLLVTLASGLISASPPLLEASQQAVATQSPAAVCSQVWVGRETAIEEFLLHGAVVKIEDVPIGVTKPQRATLEPGGPVTRFAWKPIRPGYSRGFMESYKAEIAAYRMDRMLDLHMVPPIVERKLDGLTGAAILWIEETHPWSLTEPPQGPEPAWSMQLSRMKMFDLLIANIDRNQGNLLYDADWHLFLIDHSRAFTNKKDLKNIPALGRVDRTLWDKMSALTLESLEAGLGRWVSTNEKKALLVRRDRMTEAIADMVAKRGEANVFYD